MPGGGKGGGTSTVNVNNSGTTQVVADSAIEIKGLDNIKSDSTSRMILDIPNPIRTDGTSRTELAITRPIQSENTSQISLDLKPVAVDLCLNVNMNLPSKCIRQPYQQHFGITLFGMEIFGFNMSGESRIVIEDLPNKPQIAWGGEQTVSPRTQPQKTQVQSGPDGGLRIRLG